MDALRRHYRRVTCIDFEFGAPPGGRPEPRCLVARELFSGRLVRQWLDGEAGAAPPYGVGHDELFVAYYASAELGCHLALGWQMPARILDLCAEFKLRTSGLAVPCGRGLLGALAWHGLPAIDADEKESMRALALRGGPYTAGERAALLEYCQSDVDALAGLLRKMLPRLDLGRALLRGRYMVAAARMEWNGVPIDTKVVARLRDGWDRIKGKLVQATDPKGEIYKSNLPAGPPSFSSAKFADFLSGRGIPWPRLDSGALDLKDDTFRQMAKLYPDAIGPIRELRHALGKLRLSELAVGADGRNRALLGAFGSKTGRNQPSSAKFIFGPSVWLRSLIRPEPGRALAYIDWSQQELGIAAALSGDPAMQEAYRSGDFYLTFAKLAGAVPANATKESHSREREQFKVVSLAVLYGQSAGGLAHQLDVPPCRGRELLDLHRQTFPQFWKWSETVQDMAELTNRMQTCFGWEVHVTAATKPPSLLNFPMQANGAEMMRLNSANRSKRSRPTSIAS